MTVDPHMTLVLQRAMLRANKEAIRGLGTTSPNPIVGAVILSQDGKEIASGFHSGGDHAEIIAMKNARDAGMHDFSSATLVVTLEPCNHTGKTPPCSLAIIEAGFNRVVYATVDPNPIARGGAQTLKTAGIEVIGDVEREFVSYSNRAWLKKVTTGLPWIVSKIAATLDGKIAASDGSSQWITSQESRVDVAHLRNQADAIVTSTETVLQDNPDLTPRFSGNNPTGRTLNPVRVIMGEREINKNARIMNDRAENYFIKNRSFDSLLSLAQERQWNQLLVEAGAEFNSALLEADLIDEIVLYQAPTLLGRGKDFAGGLTISTLAERRDMSFGEVRRIGHDLRIQLLRNKSSFAELFNPEFSRAGEK
jgi:diaminohydroxyphosphoribosylaminopyrimidine deaminase/5-amino-6-(5-phosphoribosylamino)uracil reductase